MLKQREVRKHFRVGTLFALAVFLVAACASQPSATPTATPTPGPRPTLTLSDPATQARVNYEMRPDELKFAYSEDVVVTISPWWGTGLYLADAVAWHLPTGASAHRMWEPIVFLDGTPEPTPFADVQGRFEWHYFGEEEGIAVLKQALSDEGLLSKVDAWVKLRLGVWEGPSEFGEKPALVLWAEPIDDEMGRLLKAEIVGGPDNNPDLYCAVLEWRDGEGGSTIAPGTCGQLDASFKVTREFDQLIDYARPGTYDASLWIRTMTFTLSALTTIDVP